MKTLTKGCWWWLRWRWWQSDYDVFTQRGEIHKKWDWGGRRDWSFQRGRKQGRLIDVLRWWWWLLMNILQNNDEYWWWFWQFWSWSFWELRILEIDMPPFQGYNDPDNHFKVTMTQTYTKQFQCEYKLQRYPFDTQVTIIIIVVSSNILFGAQVTCQVQTNIFFVVADFQIFLKFSRLPFRFLLLHSRCKYEIDIFRSARLKWLWTLYHRLQSN